MSAVTGGAGGRTSRQSARASRFERWLSPWPSPWLGTPELFFRASGMEAGGGIAHARTRHRRRPDIIDRHGARHDPTPTGRDREAELFRGLEVDDEIELHRLLDGKVAGVGSLQDAIDTSRRPAEVVRRIRPVGRQAAVVGVRT